MANENDIGGKVGLDVTDFKTGVSDLNRQIKVIDSGFRAAAAGMDDWGKSEEGLRGKINSLSQITDLQKQKVANLTEIYKKVAAEKGETSKAAQDLQITINKETAALNKNLKELDNTSTALNNFGKESIDTAKDLDKLNQSTDETKKKLSDMGGNIAKGAAAGIAAIGAAAVTAIGGIFTFSNDTTKALNDIQTKTGYSDEAMKGMKETMLSIYNNNFGESLTDIGASMATIGQQTGETGKELQELTQDALMLRDTFDFEVTESTRSAKMMMDQFGLSGKESFNLIAQGAQWGLDKNGDLLDTINEYSATFKAQGFSAEEMFNMFQNGAASGTFSVDKLGDAVKEFGIRSKDGSKSTGEAFKALGLDVNATSMNFAKGGEVGQKAFTDVNKKLLEMKDPLLQNQIGTALWGSMWEDLGVKGISALTETKGEISNTTDALKGINDVKYNDIGSAFEGLKRGLITSISGPIEKEITPRINDMIGALKNVDVTPIVNGLSWIIDNANNIATGAVAIGTGMATWNVVSMIQGVVKSIKAYQLANEGATIAQWAMNVAMSANPIGIIIAVIAGLVAAIIYLWNTNEGFRNTVIGIWNSILAAGQAVWGWLVNFFTVDIPGAFNAVANFFTNFPAIVGQLIINIMLFFNELPGKIGYALGFAIGTIIKFGVDFGLWIVNTIPKLISNIGSFFANLPGNIATTFRNVLGAAQQLGINLIIWAATAIPRVISNVTGFFNDLPGKMVGIGANIVEGLWDGIANMIGWLKNKVSDFTGGIVKGIKGSLGIHSPSTVMRDQVGLQIGAGLAVGIDDSSSQVNRAMAGLNKQVIANGEININSKVNDPSNSGNKSSFSGNGNTVTKEPAGATYYLITNLDSREVARTIVGPMSEELGRFIKGNSYANANAKGGSW